MSVFCKDEDTLLKELVTTKIDVSLQFDKRTPESNFGSFPRVVKNLYYSVKR